MDITMTLKRQLDEKHTQEITIISRNLSREIYSGQSSGGNKYLEQYIYRMRLWAGFTADYYGGSNSIISENITINSEMDGEIGHQTGHPNEGKGWAKVLTLAPTANKPKIMSFNIGGGTYESLTELQNSFDFNYARICQLEDTPPTRGNIIITNLVLDVR